MSQVKAIRFEFQTAKYEILYSLLDSGLIKTVSIEKNHKIIYQSSWDADTLKEKQLPGGEELDMLLRMLTLELVTNKKLD